MFLQQTISEREKTDIMKKSALVIACTAMMPISCNDIKTGSAPNPSGVNPANPSGIPAVHNTRDGDTLTGKGMVESKMEIGDITKINSTLILTDRQKQKLDSIKQKYQDSLKGMDGQNIDIGIRAELDRDIRDVLTPDQLEKFHQVKQERK